MPPAKVHRKARQNVGLCLHYNTTLSHFQYFLPNFSDTQSAHHKRLSQTLVKALTQPPCCSLKFNISQIYANARGFMRLRRLRREETLAENASNIPFMSVTALKSEKKKTNE